MSVTLNHQHAIISFQAPATAKLLSELTGQILLSELVKLLDMNKLMGPYTIRCDTVGNEGVTGVVVIETSHCSFHAWDEGLVQMDLYSCKDFDVKKIVDYLAHFFSIDYSSIRFQKIDRNW